MTEAASPTSPSNAEPRGDSSAGVEERSGLLRRLLRYPRRHPLRFLLFVVIAQFLVTPTIIVTRAFFVGHAAVLPRDIPGETAPEIQTEGFTCGMHAIHAVYRAYGLDPEVESIRWRLGVDTKALFWLPSSTGALHPDIFMVLKQDGFDVHSIELGLPSSHDDLLAHLETGHALLLLVRRRENDALHWVAAERAPGESYRIVDSLFSEPYLESAEFTDRHVVTALAVTPSGELRISIRDSLAHLSDGSKEPSRFRERMKQLTEE